MCAGFPPAVAAFQTAWGQARTPALSGTHTRTAQTNVQTPTPGGDESLIMLHGLHRAPRDILDCRGSEDPVVQTSEKIVFLLQFTQVLSAQMIA